MGRILWGQACCPAVPMQRAGGGGGSGLGSLDGGGISSHSRRDLLTAVAVPRGSRGRRGRSTPPGLRVLAVCRGGGGTLGRCRVPWSVSCASHARAPVRAGRHLAARRAGVCTCSAPTLEDGPRRVSRGHSILRWAVVWVGGWGVGAGHPPPRAECLAATSRWRQPLQFRRLTTNGRRLGAQ